MQKQHKDILRSIVTNLRRRLAGSYDASGTLHRGDLDRELERLGVALDGTVTPADALANPTPADLRAYQAADARLAEVQGEAARVQVRGEIVERAAYTWINRLLALRSMEARGLIDETLRPNSAYDGIPEALYLLRHTEPGHAQGPDGGWWAVIDDACRTYADLLPGLFDPTDPNAALRPSTPALLDCLRSLGGQLPSNTTYPLEEVEATFRDPDALGWAYQFYQAEAKERVYAKLGAGGKVETRAEIAAATQLFTEPYMVKWLLQNSLGRSYAETYPDSKLPATWKYYVRSEGTLTQAGAGTSEAAGTDGEGADGAKIQPLPLAQLTLLDPCMGSGHILREGFDMLYAMYKEQEPGLAAAEIARRILSCHLYGIDIDPRASQLAGLTLVLRAWEIIQAEDRSLGARDYFVRTSLSLATTPSLAPRSLDRHLASYPEDELYRPILAAVFAALEQAPLLGSLLRPEVHVDTAVAAFQKQHGKQLGLIGERATSNRLMEELGTHELGEWKRLLLDRVRHSFAREARESNVGAQLLGREASEGMHLLHILDRRYAVVCTNPPYLSDKSMLDFIRNYVKTNYKLGKKNLYSAFMLLSNELCMSSGRWALVTQRGWTIQKHFEKFRSFLLSTLKLESVCDLGPGAFEEVTGENVSVALVAVVKQQPRSDDLVHTCSTVGIADPKTIAELLQQQGQYRSTCRLAFKSLPGSLILCDLPASLIALLTGKLKLRTQYPANAGLWTGDDVRFVRGIWEGGPQQCGWIPLTKGGSYRKWYGLTQHCVRWGTSGEMIKTLINEKYPYLNGNWEWVVKNSEYYFAPGATYSFSASGSLGARVLPPGRIFHELAPLIAIPQEGATGALAALNSRIYTILLRAISDKLRMRADYVNELPQVPSDLLSDEGIMACVRFCVQLAALWARHIPLEIDFLPFTAVKSLWPPETAEALDAAKLSVENYIEGACITVFQITQPDIEHIYRKLGRPAGSYPLIESHDRFPDPMSANLQVPSLPPDFFGHFGNHRRISPDLLDLSRIKSNLQALYEAGPGAKVDDLDLDEVDHQEDEEEEGTVAHIPIPAETFLEELSVKLQIHPISVYWLLEELRAGGMRCKPEEKRLLEERLSIIVLRLLGHCWPMQIETGESIPGWADSDGVIPLIPYTGEMTLEDRVRGRLRDEDGELGAQRYEGLLVELTGRTLAEWLRRDFFRRHVSQFKKRPIAWHLASIPAGDVRGRRSGAQPAFECMVYYHRTPGDILARIRTQYVEPLVARQRVAQVQASSDTDAAVAAARIQELEDFAARLRRVEEEGFACSELNDLLAAEPLDRWSGDGITPPASQAALLAQEQAWAVDINDGVRVNIAPLQAAGLLAADVLNARDLRKAVADRARWRSDERRWVRAGIVPRCGWMADDIPESPQWTRLAPQREAERVRLEERRRAVTQ